MPGVTDETLRQLLSEKAEEIASDIEADNPGYDIDFDIYLDRIGFSNYGLIDMGEVYEEVFVWDDESQSWELAHGISPMSFREGRDRDHDHTSYEPGGLYESRPGNSVDVGNTLDRENAAEPENQGAPENAVPARTLTYNLSSQHLWQTQAALIRQMQSAYWSTNGASWVRDGEAEVEEDV